MKKSITLLAGLAVAAMSTQSFADTTIRITGSTAFRGQVHAALISSGGGFGPTAVAWSNDTPGNASKASYANYSKGTSPNKITVKTSWSGAVGGLIAIKDQRTDQKFLPDATTGEVAKSVAVVENVACDIGFTDMFQNTTSKKAPQVVQDVIVGIVPFRCVTNYGDNGSNPITSINYQQARALWSAGSLPVSAITGNPADLGTVYAAGRDPDSGTRVTYFAETGIGATSSVFQWEPAGVTAGTNTGISGNNITDIVPVPQQTVFGDTFSQGNGGYASGGTLAKLMRYNTHGATVSGAAHADPIYFITYLSKGDADTAIGADGTSQGGQVGKLIKFENSDAGSDSYPTVTTSVDTANLAVKVANGSHPFWCYEHIISMALTPGSDAANVFTTLSTLVPTLNSSGIIYDDATTLGSGQVHMAVERATDGAKILPRN